MLDISYELFMSVSAIAEYVPPAPPVPVVRKLTGWLVLIFQPFWFQWIEESICEKAKIKTRKNSPKMNLLLFKSNLLNLNWVYSVYLVGEFYHTSDQI